MNTDSLIASARARFDHVAARRLLKEKYEAKMIFAHAGGMWKAGPELLTLLATVSEYNSAVILDLYDNPIQVNVPELRQLASERWQELMNAWLVEHDELKNKR